MINSSGTPHGLTTLVPGGMDAGGWVTGIDIAADGYMVTRNDTAPGHIRGPSDTQSRELFVAGITYPNSYAIFKNPAYRTYDVCICSSDSTKLWALAFGLLLKSTDRGLNWAKNTSFNSNGLGAGVADPAISTVANENYRIGGQHIRCSPTNSNHLIFCNPSDKKSYYSTDGTTVQQNASLPLASDTEGGSFHFVSDTDVWATIKGQGTYHSTTGVGGTFSLVTGGPTIAGSIAHGGGNVYFVGDMNANDTQLYLWNGTAFSQPSGVTGKSVVVNPNDTTKVYVLMVGGGVRTSTNTGGSFTLTAYLYPKLADDVPYLARSESAYMALGAAVFHPTNNQIILTNGIGVFTLDSPPGTSGTKITSISKGIRQMLPHNIVVTRSSGDVMIPVEDKAGFCFTRANAKQQAYSQAPDNTLALRQGGNMDYARDNELVRAMVYTNGAKASLSADGGYSWSAIPTVPTYTYYDANSTTSTPGTPFFGGDIAVANAGNMMWMSTSNSGGGTSQGGVQYTQDGGNSWFVPTFGASVSMVGAMWHHSYTERRRVLHAYKGAASTFYVFCNGTGIGNAADIAMTGVWKSTNGGPNFTNIRPGHFVSYSVDFWQSKFKLNHNRAGHMFWVQGATNNYPTAPYSGGVWFTKDDWATETVVTGFSEPDDMDFGAKFSASQLYETIYFLAWRGGVYGVWRSTDFNPASPNSATWILQEQWLMGRTDNDNVIAADPIVPGLYYVGISGGGFGVGVYYDPDHII